jgi:hypothetical protein
LAAQWGIGEDGTYAQAEDDYWMARVLDRLTEMDRLRESAGVSVAEQKFDRHEIDEL